MTVKEIWIKCLGDVETVNLKVIGSIMELIEDYPGDYLVVVFAESEMKMRKFTNIPRLSKDAVPILEKYFGEGNVKVVEKEVPDPVKPVKRTDSRKRTNELLDRIANALERIELKLEDKSYCNR
jgi:hypothetical protein